jgi:hypothetical protein
VEQSTETFIKSYARFRNDPLGFVYFAYPWGQEKTFLAEEEGPDEWQIDILSTLGAELQKRELHPDQVFAAIQIAVASGHGIGKTALIAWLIDWFICTRLFPQVVVTAGTASQLEKKTWRELAKWHKVSLHKQWFEWTATKYYLKERPDTWFAAAIPWSEHNADAFAGTHEKYVLILFDEGSTIADIIYETAEGAMTTEQCIWVVFGNPIRNTGRFKACFNRFKNYWITRKVDSRSAKKANKAQIAQWAEQYGEDSDFFRKRVKGEFPLQSSNQLIPEADVLACRVYEAVGYETFPIRISCDVARFGEDDTVITVMQGRKFVETTEMHHRDTVQTYTKIVEIYNHYCRKHERIAIFVDDIGVGGGVTDMLRRAGLPVIAVNAGARAKDPEQFINVRIEMWWNMAAGIKEGIDLSALSKEQFERLKDDLINIEYFQQPTSQRYQLEGRDSLLERDLPSPDRGTALALSFAYPVPHAVQSGTRKFTKAAGGSSTMQKKRAKRGYS